MDDLKSLRRKYWFYVWGWVACIYSTLYIVRPICTFLKETLPFSLFINILMGVLLTCLVIGLWSKARVKQTSSYVILAMVLSAYIYGFVTIPYPEEKIHFIEYGVLAFLSYKAIHLDLQKPLAYGAAFLLTSVLGWVDEGIQYLLPNRYYQIEDVILNCISGILGLLLVFIFTREEIDQKYDY